jgi:hypothetical protein
VWSRNCSLGTLVAHAQARQPAPIALSGSAGADLYVNICRTFCGLTRSALCRWVGLDHVFMCSDAQEYTTAGYGVWIRRHDMLQDFIRAPAMHSTGQPRSGYRFGCTEGARSCTR